MTYSLAASPDANYVVLRKVLPAAVDMSQADFLLVPFKGDASGLARSLELKLEDSSGCRTTVLISSVTSLPVFRTLVLSLQQFKTPDGGTCSSSVLDFTKVTAIEIGISENGDDVLSKDGAANGTLTFDDFTFVPRSALAVPQSAFECVTARGDVMGRIVRNLLRRQQAHGLIATWYPETTPEYNMYSETLALIVFAREYARTGRSEYATAAKLLADRIVNLQTNGAWNDAYIDSTGGQVVSATQAQWEGGVAWVVIGLKIFLDKVSPQPSTPYAAAIDAARAWLEQRIAAYQTKGGASGGITDGTEGNISTYFALVAAGATTSAANLAAFITNNCWDARAAPADGRA